MKKGISILFKILKGVTAFAILCAFLVATFSGVRQKQDQACRDIRIHVDYSDGNSWITAAQVQELIVAIQGKSPQGVTLRQLRIADIEKGLEKNPYIRDAEVFVRNNNSLQINIVQKKALFRVLTTTGVGYYVSENQETIPLCPNFTPQVPVALGNIPADSWGEQNKNRPISLFTLMDAIVADSVLNALTDQVWMEDAQQFLLIPRMGCQQIILGNAENLNRKFKKVKLFYQKAIGQQGWNYYESIDVKFENQIVALKRDSV
jgi:cell division protein FtsQ